MPFKPDLKKLEKLAEKLHENYPEVKPKLTFNFPLNGRRKTFLDHIINKKLSTSDLCSFLESHDYAEKFIALSCIGNITPILDETQDKYIDLLKEYWSTFSFEIFNFDSFDKKKDIIIKGLIDIKKNEKARQILEQIQKGTYKSIHIDPWELKKFDKKTIISKDKKTSNKFLIANQKSILANSYTKETMENISNLQEISKTLEKEFDTYVGIIIVGSLWKGYFQPTSDIDWFILYKDQGLDKDSSSIRPRFIELAKNKKINLCSKYTSTDMLCTDTLISEPDNYNYIYNTINGIILFSGLFFGNWKELVTIQKHYLDNINEKYWEEIEQLLLHHLTEINIDKYKRLKLSINELRPILLLTKLPPSLSEVKTIINNRYNRLVLNK